MSLQSSIRIIGGKWRSRKVHFLGKETLRPTPDRVRETLFNWLMPYIVDAECLDLFAGSGVLGFEALSRGAKSVVAIENDRDCYEQIIQNKQDLHADNMRALHANTINWLAENKFSVDIVFVDPPYQAGLLFATLELLETKGWLRKEGLVYFEQDKPLLDEQLPVGWQIWRQSKAGKVYYFLAKKGS